MLSVLVMNATTHGSQRKTPWRWMSLPTSGSDRPGGWRYH